jgi:hypothetical protein
MQFGCAVASGKTNSGKDKRMKPGKCPVCDWKIKDGGKEVTLNSGAVVVVCCDGCAEKLKAEPDKFTSRK